MKRKLERKCSSPTIGGSTMGDVYVRCGCGAEIYDSGMGEVVPHGEDITLAQLNRLVLDHLREKAGL